MSNLEKISFYIGSALLGFSLVALINRQREANAANAVRRAANRANNAPVEVLADTLKEAWAPYHNA